MKSATLKAFLAILVVFAVSSVAFAFDIPLRNWQVPTTDSLGKQVDVTLAVPFVGVEPCRIVDTRGGGVFTGAYGPPALVMNATRNFDLNSAAHCPGIPGGVDAYSLNVTVASPAGPGDIRMWPQNNPPTVVTSVQNWSSFGAAFAIANSVIMPAGSGGGVTVQMAGTTGHVLIDINGYFSDSGNTSTYFDWHTTDTFTAGHFFNSDTTAASNGVEAETSSLVNGAAGLEAIAEAFATSGSYTFGVKARTDSQGFDSAGVKGISGYGDPLGDTLDCGACYTAGVRGVSGSTSNSYGVLGIGRDRGTAGILLGATGTSSLAEGRLGYQVGTTNYAVYASGDYGGSGAKYFIEPHPSDASKVIRYISLEGPEAGTYFRGRARFERGLATIPVPDHFRMVTDEEGVTVQITPIGEMASVAVLRVGLDAITVKSSRNVEFFYTVQGVRKTHKHLQPIVAGEEYAPASAKETMPESLTAAQKQLLIQNGTYNADGSINMETAVRLGWDQKWAKKDPTAAETPEKHKH